MRLHLPAAFGLLLLLPGEAGAQDLDATATPPGFAGPIVPRSTGDASPTSAPATALTNATNYINWGIVHSGADPFPAWRTIVQLDGISLATRDVSAGSTAGWHTWVNIGPFAVRGGRHTLTAIADANGDVAETNEANNAFSQQFLWPSLALDVGAPQTRVPPPDPGGFPQPNVDGFVVGRWGGYPWVVAMAPLDPTDDYDLRMYSGAAQTLDAGSSFWRGPGTDFVVYSQYISEPTPYAGVVRYSVGNGGNYVIDLEQAYGHVYYTPGSYSIPSQVLPANQLVAIYQFVQYPASHNWITLHTAEGAPDLAFVVDPSPTADGITYGLARQVSMVYSGSMTSAIDTAQCGTPNTLNLVIYRPDATRLNEPVPFGIEWNLDRYVGVDGAGAGPRIGLAAAPNPLVGEARFRVELPEAGPVRLLVFDVRGRLVAQAFEGTLPAGSSTVRWNPADGGRALRAGVYCAVLAAGSQRTQARFIVLGESGRVERR